MPLLDWNDLSYPHDEDAEGHPKTLGDLHKWHLSRDEREKYDEYSLLYYNVGPDAAYRFAHYANLNPVKALANKDQPPPLVYQIRVPRGDQTEDVLKPGADINMPFKFAPFFQAKYQSLNKTDAKFFKAWYMIEKNIFYKKTEKIQEQRFLFAENPERYEDVLATMLALKPLKYDEEKLPVYDIYFNHMAAVEMSEDFQTWWKAYSTGQIEISKAFFDTKVEQLVYTIINVFTVKGNIKKKRVKDTRKLTIVLSHMDANINLGSNRSWYNDDKAKRLIEIALNSRNNGDGRWFRRYRMSVDDANEAKKISLGRRNTKANFDFGPGLLQYNKDIGPLHNTYITDNVYHAQKGVYKRHR